MENNGKVHVLLVEDDEDDYLITRALLAKSPGEAFVLTWSDRLESARARLAEGRVDVVLLDFALPDSKGMATFERIRDAAPATPIIFLADVADEASGVEAVKHGAQDYLIKGSTDIDRLVRAIGYAIERKRWEEELKQYQEKLQDRVDDATRDLLTANEKLRTEIVERRGVEVKLREAVDRLEAHNYAKSQFVSNVSHELRTPLASITHAAENLRSGVLGRLDDRQLAYVRMIEEDCRRLTATVSDILDLSRIEANRLVLNRSKFHFGRFVARAVAALQTHLDRKGHGLQLDAPDEAIFVDCDATKLERVIVNLLGNAVKFTPDGGEIRVVVRAGGDAAGMIALDVIDNGIGISAEHLPHVTERYYRVGEHVSGTGLGLALASELVEMHGGRLAMFSPPLGRERGTQVSVLLPRAPPLDVIAVDDDKTIRDLLARQLVRYGCVPRCFGSSRESLAYLATGARPDMMIVDVFIPDMDGFELIANVKSDVTRRQMPILVITGRDLDDEQQAFLEGFGVDCLKKPWRQGELIKRLELATLMPAGRAVYVSKGGA